MKTLFVSIFATVLAFSLTALVSAHRPMWPTADGGGGGGGLAADDDVTITGDWTFNSIDEMHDISNDWAIRDNGASSFLDMDLVFQMRWSSSATESGTKDLQLGRLQPGFLRARNPDSGNGGAYAMDQQTTTLGVGAATFTVTSNMVILTGDGGGNTLTTIVGPLAIATWVMIEFVDSNVTISDVETGADDTVDLSAAFTSADDTTLLLLFNGTHWQEIARSTN